MPGHTAKNTIPSSLLLIKTTAYKFTGTALHRKHLDIEDLRAILKAIYATQVT